MLDINCLYAETYSRLFFLTPVGKKTKTQAKNSRKKLNLREAFSSLQEKPKKKKSIFVLNMKFSYGVPLYIPFSLTNILTFYQFQTIVTKN